MTWKLTLEASVWTLHYNASGETPAHTASFWANPCSAPEFHQSGRWSCVKLLAFYGLCFFDKPRQQAAAATHIEMVSRITPYYHLY